ncbi:Probable protein phosphatase 2C 54 [Galdieria sulphuraria]|uniref:Protein phosphatase 2C-like protein n=1 Tax=Galdieria sulphuraria TaxID=130081 RepID=M2VT94_GALSU|nr:protein phosphatase 2C-like protein [Galdieria sulphuraria]EME26396.1 protein phosphatase 2C-like protein [Galdieria sulphuraria]GJD11871.1 Probable protein phosphatase 2C 54 [Galdieria sulphuraria]|eukprot:XP_005702916.1 protein phosphatase 2C-like protein [Galdieria sulphuraria]
MSSLEQEDQVAVISRSLTCNQYSFYLRGREQVQENSQVFHSRCHNCAVSESDEFVHPLQRTFTKDQENWFPGTEDDNNVVVCRSNCLNSHVRSLSFSCASLCGTNHKRLGQPNQDRYSSLFIPPLSYAFGVFDGHGMYGGDAAEIVADCLLPFLSEQLQRGTPPKFALELAFRHAATVLDSSPYGANSGTTATVVLISEDEVYVSNVGDSGVVLGRCIPQGRECLKMEPSASVRECLSEEEKSDFYWEGYFVTASHRLESLEERSRVEATDAIIDGEYIVSRLGEGGALNLTRTLGDLDMRACGVLADPFTNHLVLGPCDKFLIIASDGLWDSHDRKLSPQNIVDIISNNLCCTKDACRQLLQLAEEDGPFDDCTVIFALFS